MEEPTKVKHVKYPVKEDETIGYVKLSALIKWAEKNKINTEDIVIDAEEYHDEAYLDIYAVVKVDPKVYAAQMKEYRKFQREESKKQKEKQKAIAKAFRFFNMVNADKAEETKKKLLNFQLED